MRSDLMEKIKTVVIHSRKLAIYLQFQGFILIGVEDDLKEKRKIFLFKDSFSLRQRMIEYKEDQHFHNYLLSISQVAR